MVCAPTKAGHSGGGGTVDRVTGSIGVGRGGGADCGKWVGFGVVIGVGVNDGATAGVGKAGADKVAAGGMSGVAVGNASSELHATKASNARKNTRIMVGKRKLLCN